MTFASTELHMFVELTTRLIIPFGHVLFLDDFLIRSGKDLRCPEMHQLRMPGVLVHRRKVPVARREIKINSDRIWGLLKECA